MVGKHDLNDALEKWTLLFNEDTHGNPLAAQAIIIAMFVAATVLNVVFLARYFVPWTRRILLESTRVAHLLGEVRLRLRRCRVIATHWQWAPQAWQSLALMSPQ